MGELRRMAGARPFREDHLLMSFHGVERRNWASRDLLVRRVRGEFDEMPGLRLTFAQAKLLFVLEVLANEDDRLTRYLRDCFSDSSRTSSRARWKPKTSTLLIRPSISISAVLIPLLAARLLWMMDRSSESSTGVW